MQSGKGEEGSWVSGEGGLGVWDKSRQVFLFYLFIYLFCLSCEVKRDRAGRGEVKRSAVQWSRAE